MKQIQIQQTLNKTQVRPILNVSSCPGVDPQLQQLWFLLQTKESVSKSSWQFFLNKCKFLYTRFSTGEIFLYLQNMESVTTPKRLHLVNYVFCFAACTYRPVFLITGYLEFVFLIHRVYLLLGRTFHSRSLRHRPTDLICYACSYKAIISASCLYRVHANMLVDMLLLQPRCLRDFLAFWGEWGRGGATADHQFHKRFKFQQSGTLCTCAESWLVPTWD